MPRLYQHGESPYYFVRWFESKQAAIESAEMSNDTTCPICEQPNCIKVKPDDGSKHLMSTEFTLSRNMTVFVTVEMGNEAGCNATLRRQIAQSAIKINAQDVAPVRKLVVIHNAEGGYYDVSWSWSDDVTPLATTLYWCETHKLAGKPNKFKVITD